MKKSSIFAGGALLAAGVVVGLGWAQAQQMGHGKGMMGMGAMHEMMHGGGAEHDMTHMPMLQGKDTTEAEVAELADMFMNFPDITRTVENLPNGIKTITETQNEELRASIVSHVSGMINRVEEGRDPEIFIESPTLKILFERGNTIKTEIEATDTGVAVIQTSDDPEVVAALQKHAGEVSDLAARGMMAVHEAMAANPEAYK